MRIYKSLAFSEITNYLQKDCQKFRRIFVTSASERF